VFFYIAVVAVVLLAVWSTYGVAETMFSSGITKMSSIDPANIVTKYQATESLGTTGSESRAVLSYLKISLALGFLGISIIGFMFYLFSGDFNPRSIGIVASISVIMLFVNLVIYISGLYGDEALIRAFYFSLIPLIYFSLKLYDSKKLSTLLVLFFFIATPLHVVLYHSNESFYYYSPGSVTGVNFFVGHLTSTADIDDVGGLTQQYLIEINNARNTLNGVNVGVYTAIYPNVLTRQFSVTGEEFDQIRNAIDTKQMLEGQVYNNGDFILLFC